jgi:uncharacterized protein with GYD domain
MITFMCFLNWTDQGAKTIKDAGKRSEAAKGMIEKLGGRLLSAYVVAGQYDVVVVVDMPDGDAMTKLAIGLASQGTVRTTTTRAIAIEDFRKLAAAAP